MFVESEALFVEGSRGIVLKVCITRCKGAHYCGRACQTENWRAGTHAVLRYSRGVDAAADSSDIANELSATGR